MSLDKFTCASILIFLYNAMALSGRRSRSAPTASQELTSNSDDLSLRTVSFKATANSYGPSLTSPPMPLDQNSTGPLGDTYRTPR
jgi:hypothetical protein